MACADNGAEKKFGDYIGKHEALVTIVANGELTLSPGEARLLSMGHHLICCDGAYKTLKRLGFKPEFVVGDGDSIAPRDRAALGERFVHYPDQDTNDLDKAVRFARERYGQDIGLLFVGLGGKREDHAIANFFRLLSFVHDGRLVLAATPHGCCYAVKNKFRILALKPGQPVSIFAPYPGTRLTSTGLDWPLDGVDLSDPWSATLNRVTSGDVTLTSVGEDHPFLVYIASVNP